MKKIESYFQKSGTKEGEEIGERNVRENAESGITDSVQPEEMPTASVSTNVSDTASKVYKFKSDWIKAIAQKVGVCTICGA